MTQNNANVPTVVLVHGGFADASFWTPVIQQLQAQDVPVLAPANPLRGLASDAEYIASFVRQIDGPVLLVGHSYGQWLRRRRRIAESRAPLRTARDAFDQLGCAAWADQARRELRASGESSRRRTPDARDQLTAQELQIAHLAAEGLSNRQIGQRLYLSHRTVGTHLYRIFPKLGVTARTELSSALSND